MAIGRVLRVGKSGSMHTPLIQIKGDAGTQVITMCIPRHYGGVDLRDLLWSVTVENAAGSTDEYHLKSSAGENDICLDWLVGGTATATAGLTRFKLSGYADSEGKALVWQSGTYAIQVCDTIEYIPGGETEQALTEVQKLILYVDGELNAVIQAGKDAKTAAEAANKAADRANSVADGKNEGRITALEKFTTQPAAPYEVTAEFIRLDNFEGMPMNVVTRIEPAQAGSGDPYPGGGRKNLLENTATTKTVNGLAFTVHADGSVTVSGTATDNTWFDVNTNVVLLAGEYIISGCKGGSDSTYFLYATVNTKTVAEVKTSEALFAVAAGDTVGTHIVVIKGTTVSETIFPMIRLASDTDATYAPYANIRPITGFTGAKLTRCGKNLLPNTANTQTVNGITFTVNDDGTITANGTSAERAQIVAGKVELPAGDYIVSTGFVTDANTKGTAYLTYLKDDTVIYTVMDGYAEKSFTLTEAKEVTYLLDIRTAGITVKDFVYSPMIRLATITDATYEPYQGDTFSATFGQTVYGGTLNWNTGVLTVDRGILTMDGVTSGAMLTGTSGSRSNFYYTGKGISDALWPANNDTVSDIVSSHFKAVAWNRLAEHSKFDEIAMLNNGYVGFAYNGTRDEANAYLAAQNAAGTPVQVCYKLANPTTIQLIPQEILALQGANNIWSDAGKTTVSGRKDVLWLTSYLIDKLRTHASAIISLGGNI